MTWNYFDDPRPEVQALIDASGRRCLDIGCGAGALSAALRRAGASHVAGIEADPEAAARARSRLDVVVEGSVLDAQLPFTEGEFDLMVFADVLEHLPDPDAALDRCLPFLASTGEVVVSVPNMRFWVALVRLMADRWEYSDHGVRDRTHLRIFTRRSLSRMLDSHGLEIRALLRNQRLFDDQSQIGRMGTLATRVARTTVGRWPMRELLTYQYVVLARPRP